MKLAVLALATVLSAVNVNRFGISPLWTETLCEFRYVCGEAALCVKVLFD